MKYVDEYRNSKIANKLSDRIHRLLRGNSHNYKFMEVCGTHTNTFFRFGLRSLLPKNLQLISGPGCPVCVTDTSYIDNSILLAKLRGVIITTFGDMIKVPGTSSSLYKERAEGSDIRITYSSLDALKIAEKNPSKEIIFLAVGFEATAPTVGMAILEAKKRNIENFSIYSSHKLIPPAMRHLLKDRDISVNGFILPAHVSAIIGKEAYCFLKDFDIPGVIAGFEPLDMLQGIVMLLEQLNSGRSEIEIQYDRVVKRKGNKKAQHIIEEVFTVSDAVWRGLGKIGRSGLRLRDELRNFDAEKRFKIKKTRVPLEDKKYCLCGEILKGKKAPEDCKLYANICTPENPMGPCMVSSEGSCGIYYRYRQ